MRLRSFIILVVSVAAFCLVTMLAVAVSEGRRGCARAVEARADNRAMWEFLINLSPPEPDDPVGQAFIVELDRRLPPYECGGLFSTNPRPVSVEE